MAIYDYLTDRGVIVPDTSQTRESVEQRWKAAFGDDLDVSPETPQGVFITLQTEAEDAHARYAAEIANQINPSMAKGVFLDAIGAQLQGFRHGATYSIINGVEFRGIPGTNIPAGSYMTTNAGDAFIVLTQLTIGENGLVIGSARADEKGPIPAPIGSLVTVASSVLGWETVYNPQAAAVGQEAESDAAFKARREKMLALMSMSTPEAIQSVLADMPDVASWAFRENTTNQVLYVGGVTLKPHSVWLCVDGGVDYEIASALMLAKTIGAGFNGDVSVDFIDPVSGQLYSGDQAVLFDRPAERMAFIRVTVAESHLNLIRIIPDAVVAYSRGQIGGGDGFVVGAPISPFEIAGAINIYEPGVFVRKVEVSIDGGVTWLADEVRLEIFEVARVNESSVIVVTT